MRKFFTGLVATLALIVGAGISAGPAEAAATCTIHGVDLTGWSEQTDTLFYNADFKCGGQGPDYRLHIFAELKEPVGGQWDILNCDNGSQCAVYKPSATDWYPNGTENQPSGAFNPTIEIDGLTMRIRVVVKFRNGDPDLHYNSTARVV